MFCTQTDKQRKYRQETNKEIKRWKERQKERCLDRQTKGVGIISIHLAGDVSILEKKSYISAWISSCFNGVSSQTERQKDRQTERQKDRKTERQKDRKTETQKHRKTVRQKDRETERWK